MLIQEKLVHLDVTSRNNPQPSNIHHIPGLSQAQAFCSVDPKSHNISDKGDSFCRHAPQTKYVTLMKGLNDVPVCTVVKQSVEDSLQKDSSATNIRSHSCPDGIRVDDLGDFKLELVRRHNPHARRVCHIKGLNDVPVCVVRDELNAEWENRFIVSPGSLAPAYSKPKKKLSDKNSDYGYLSESHSSLNPQSQDNHNTRSMVTPTCLNMDRINRDPIPPIPHRSRTSSRVSVPKMSLIPGDTGYENDLNDELDSIQALDILCSILQTNSLQTVQAWIEQATDEERTVVLKALREMKEKGLLAKPSAVYQKHLPPLQEDKVSVSYEKRWNQNKSLEDSGENLAPEPAPVEHAKPPPTTMTPNVGTQTPVSVLSQSKKAAGDRPPTRIQMSGLSRPASQMSPPGRPSTMKSVREKFMSGRSTATPAKDPGFSWTVKHRDSPAQDVISKA